MRMLHATVGLALLTAPALAQGQKITFVDPDSRIIYAQLSFPDQGDGELTLLERWCGPINTDCAQGALAVPSDYRPFFEADDGSYQSLELENNVTVVLNEVVGLDARFVTQSASGFELFRDFEMLRHNAQGGVPQPEIQAAAVIDLQDVAGGTKPLRVRLAANEGFVPGDLTGAGSIIELPDGWCGDPAANCVAASFESPGPLFYDWAVGRTSETEPEFGIMGPYEFTLERDGNALAIEIIEYLDDSRENRARFESGRIWRAAGSIPDVILASQSVDCTPATEPSIGGQDFHILRETDGACIGTVGWAVMPNPQAEISLADGWCGDNSCGALELLSDSFEDAGRPSRFYAGQENGPNLVIETTPSGWDDPVVIITSAARTRARILPAYRPPVRDAKMTLPTIGQTYALDDLPAPLGAYAFVEGRTSADGLGADGDKICLETPVIFAAGGRIVFKERGDAARGNPYSISQYFECSSFDGGPGNCVLYHGTPDAPNPVASGAGFDYARLGGGDFSMCQKKSPGNCGLLYACVRDGGAITFDRTMTNGANLVQAMIARYDGASPGFRYIDNQTIALER